MATKKGAAKKSASKKATKKTASKKSSVKKTPAKKAAKKSSTRKYSPSASKNVETEMHEMKKGTLKSSSGQKVTNPKQAIAIGLSEARRAGKKVPPPPKKG
ncbi:DUF6496 domain-containing protein [Granulicella sp. S190]|uniref:DUF6496 domain-containing protein n=1 Tax=Granulicella sp. S190 TaxID=1747226 RepID=UPI00131B73CF|nr:DUF6496 domain-containing protein [Granulicella sp. S190]